jgi:hypothetical protein
MHDLAVHPEKRDGPLSGGLKYVVWGDVLLGDGREVTLDAWADEAGVPHLPFLDPPPKVCDILWDNDPPETGATP